MALTSTWSPPRLCIFSIKQCPCGGPCLYLRIGQTCSKRSRGLMQRHRASSPSWPLKFLKLLGHLNYHEVGARAQLKTLWIEHVRACSMTMKKTPVESGGWGGGGGGIRASAKPGVPETSRAHMVDCGYPETKQWVPQYWMIMQATVLNRFPEATILAEAAFRFTDSIVYYFYIIITFFNLIITHCCIIFTSDWHFYLIIPSIIHDYLFLHNHYQSHYCAF